jgi:hypothetical protein
MTKINIIAWLEIVNLFQTFEPWDLIKIEQEIQEIKELLEKQAYPLFYCNWLAKVSHP